MPERLGYSYFHAAAYAGDPWREGVSYIPLGFLENILYSVGLPPDEFLWLLVLTNYIQVTVWRSN